LDGGEGMKLFKSVVYFIDGKPATKEEVIQLIIKKQEREKQSDTEKKGD